MKNFGVSDTSRAPADKAGFAVRSVIVEAPKTFVPRTRPPQLDESSPTSALTVMGASGGLLTHVELRDGTEAPLLRRAAALGPVRLFVGDETEFATCAEAGVFCNLVVFEIDTAHDVVAVTSSRVGLPPVYLGEDARGYLATCPFLQGRWVFDPTIDFEAVADMMRWGHPLERRTMIENFSAVRCATRLTLRAGTPPSLRNTSDDVGIRSSIDLDVAALRESQIAAFSSALRRMELDRSFLSLSGGLDSRAILMGLLAEGRSVPCVSIGSEEHSLDVRLAAAVCAAHGVTHQCVDLGETFLGGLSELVLAASRITMGADALAQSKDVFMYRQLGGRFLRRISGNLGNQVGHGGVERVSCYWPSPDVLERSQRARLALRSERPWFLSAAGVRGFATALLEDELSHELAANYCVGSSFVTQLSPYADPSLVALSLRGLAGTVAPPLFARCWLRMRDARHRILGPPIRRSFQRTLILRTDSRSRDIPFNWGWTAEGRTGWTWLRSVVDAAIDAILQKFEGSSIARGNSVGPRTGPAFPSAHDVRWLPIVKHHLRSFCADTLGSRVVQSAGVFDRAGLRRALDEHFSGKANRHDTVVAALQVALGILALSAAQSRDPALRTERHLYFPRP